MVILSPFRLIPGYCLELDTPAFIPIPLSSSDAAVSYLALYNPVGRPVASLRIMCFDLMQYITLRLDSTDEVEQWCVRHNYYIVLYHRLYVSTYIQVIFRPSFMDKSIKCYTYWDPIMLTEVIIIINTKDCTVWSVPSPGLHCTTRVTTYTCYMYCCHNPGIDRRDFKFSVF